MRDQHIGLLALLGTYTIWGLSALYYREVAHVPAIEVLAHRTVWSFVAFFAVIAVQGRIGELRTLLSLRGDRRTLGRIALAGGLVSINWFLFVHAVQIDKTLDSSLAYYISPLMAAALGWVSLGERLRGLQWPAMVLAALAVGVLTVGLGTAPWLALAMSATFVAYSVMKKRIAAGPILGMAAETTILMPFSLVYLIGAEIYGWGGSAAQPAGAFGANGHDSLILAFAGVMTGVPLLLFGVAAKRVSLSALNIGHYYNASLQLAVAVFFFAQPVLVPHLIALPLVWIAVTLFTTQAFLSERATRLPRPPL